MSTPTEDEIVTWLTRIIADGFNRSLNALQSAGAVDTTEMRRAYKGIGSRYYDLVTKQIEFTARHGARELLTQIQDDSSHRS